MFHSSISTACLLRGRFAAKTAGRRARPRGFLLSFLSACLITSALSLTACRKGPAPEENVTSLRLPQLDPASAPPATPELLAPGIVSTANGERDASFLPDHSAFYYTLWTGRFAVILEIVRSNDGWRPPDVAPFSGRYSDLEPFVTPDGSRLFFASNRPWGPDRQTTGYDIWYVDRVHDRWGDPVHLDPTVNTDADEFYPTVDESGTLYFTAALENSLGGEDIWLSRPTESGYGPPINVGPGVNTAHDEFNALIAPDGSWIAFSSFGREDGRGGGDLYFSFRDEEGNFSQAVNAGPSINSSALDFSPALSPDGGTFLFSTRRSMIEASIDTAWTYEGLTNALASPGNGNFDILLVSASFIQSLRDTR